MFQLRDAPPEGDSGQPGTHVRFTPKSRHRSDHRRCPLCAISRHRGYGRYPENMVCLLAYLLSRENHLLEVRFESECERRRLCIWPPHEKQTTNAFLKSLDCLGQRGLRDPTFLGRFAEVVFFAKSEKIADVLQFHMSPRQMITTLSIGALKYLAILALGCIQKCMPRNRSAERPAFIEWSNWNVSLTLARAPAQPATRRIPGRRPVVPAACSRARREVGRCCSGAASSR